LLLEFIHSTEKIINEMNASIEITNLTKIYDENVRALSEVNLSVNQGEVFGFLGPNGAGKSTTIRLLLGIIKPTTGLVHILGMNHLKNSIEIRKKTGYLPGEFSIYPNLTGSQILTFFSNIKNEYDERYVNVLAEKLQIDLNQQFGTLSQGNKQKIGIIQAIMHKPELIILDEPTNGLDPLVRNKFYEIISDLKDEKRTIFFSSHNISEVEKLCDRIGIIREGKLITTEKISELKSKQIQIFEIEFSETKPQKKDFTLPNIENIEVYDKTVKFTVIGNPTNIIKKVSEFEIKKLITHEPSLEGIFMTYYGDVK
tara:strand:+ start:13061 stop:13999 length:939 start_codon:yes stop_codon:yes gene_type:complete